MWWTAQEPRPAGVSAGYSPAGARRAWWRALALTLVALPVAVGLAASGARGSDLTSPAGRGSVATISAGKVLYEQNCSGCHGTQAQGGSPFGGVRSADIRGGYLRTLPAPYTKALLLRAIAQGVDQRGHVLSSVMPRWAGMLSPAQQREIVDYLWSLPASPSTGAAAAGPGGGAARGLLTPLLEGAGLLALVLAAVLVVRARRGSS